jgi:hypothetical protein
MDFVMSKGRKLSKGFCAYDRRFDINIGSAALG